LLQNLFLLLVSVILVDYSITNGFYGLLQMLVVISLGLLVFLGFGFIIAGIVQSEDQAAPLSNLLMLPQFLLAGTFFDVQALPSWLERIASILPLYYFNESMRLISLDGLYLWSPAVLQKLMGLVVWGVLVYLVSFKVFNVKSN
jgi:ABC-2 type transport system permease protein